jgi:hypothetical protein
MMIMTWLDLSFLVLIFSALQKGLACFTETECGVLSVAFFIILSGGLNLIGWVERRAGMCITVVLFS